MSIRVWSLGTELEVEGEDRTRTQGLMQRLTDDLAHGARKDVDRDWAFVAAPVLAFGLAMVFFVATHWLGLAHEDEHWQPAERIAPTVGGIIGLALGWAMWQLFPPVELLPEGQPSRFLRMRAALVSVVVALAIGIAGSAIYGAAVG